MKHEWSRDGIPFANGFGHTHGSAAVIGRKSGSAQDSWDDACTASVPTLASLEPELRIYVADQRRSHNLKLIQKELTKMLKNFLMDETGAELAEYCVAVALLVAIALVIYQVLGQGISDANSDTAAAMQNPDPGVNP